MSIIQTTVAIEVADIVLEERILTEKSVRQPLSHKNHPYCAIGIAVQIAMELPFGNKFIANLRCARVKVVISMKKCVW